MADSPGHTAIDGKNPLTLSPLCPLFPLPGEREEGEGSWGEGFVQRVTPKKPEHLPKDQDKREVCLVPSRV